MNRLAALKQIEKYAQKISDHSLRLTKLGPCLDTKAQLALFSESVAIGTAAEGIKKIVALLRGE